MRANQDFDYVELTKREIASFRREIERFRREIERSRHQCRQEISLLTAKPFSPEWNLHEQHIMAQHVVRTFHLELHILQLNKNLLDFEVPAVAKETPDAL